MHVPAQCYRRYVDMMGTEGHVRRVDLLRYTYMRMYVWNAANRKKKRLKINKVYNEWILQNLSKQKPMWLYVFTYRLFNKKRF